MSGLHPHALTLDDGPVAAGRVTAQDLCAAIADLRPPSAVKYLRCSLADDADAAALRAAGFQQVGLTRLIDVALPCDFVAPHDASVTMQWVRPGADADWDDWFAAHWRSYQRQHKINPAQDLGRAADPFIFGGRDLVEALFVSRADQLIAFASLRDGCEIGWLDTVAPDEDLDVLALVVAASLRRATAAGWTTATLEVDDAHQALWSVASRLAYSQVQTFVAWQRDVT